MPWLCEKHRGVPFHSDFTLEAMRSLDSTPLPPENHMCEECTDESIYNGYEFNKETSEWDMAVTYDKTI